MWENKKNLILENINIDLDKRTIIKDFSFDFKPGIIYSIIGPSGCGKSTLLRCIAGLQPQTSGKKHINRKYYDKPNKDIYMVDQKYVNFPWMTALDNVLITDVVKHKKITPDLTKKGYEILMNLGLDNPAKFPYEMSGGMNQRLALARLVYANPSIVLLDEPTSALDSETTKVVMNLIKWMQEQFGTTFIIVTHNEDLAESLCLPNNIIKLKKEN